MPASIRLALTRNRLMSPFRTRPACQQNDYLGRIVRAKGRTNRKTAADADVRGIETRRRVQEHDSSSSSERKRGLKNPCSRLQLERFFQRRLYA